MMHAMTETVHGKKTTRCGLTVKSNEATGWESEVTCQDCGIRWKKLSARDSLEPRKRGKLGGTKSDILTHQKEKTEMARATTLTLDRDLIEQVMQLRDQEEKKWDEIAEITGVASGKCMLMHAAGSLPKKELIKNATGADIVRLRDDQMLSWGQISVRAQLPESTCRAMYTETSGETTKGNRIGKGGRHPGESNGSTTRKAGTKPAGAKAKAVATAPQLDGITDPAEVKALLTGFAIKVNDGAGNISPMKVKTVKKVASGKAILVDGETGESRTIKLSAITAISKRKVL